MPYKITESDMTRTETTRNNIAKLMAKNNIGRWRMSQLWKLLKIEFPEDPRVAYWRDRKKTGHGYCPVTAKAMQADRRFRKISETKNKVYWELIN